MDKETEDYGTVEHQPAAVRLDPEVTLPLRFRRPDELQDYLENSPKEELLFSAIPISGEPETFHYNGREKVVVRADDGAVFDNIADFVCYVFKCDREGYPRTEYVDVVFG